MFPECLLNWMQIAVLCKTLDGGDFASIGLHGEHRAGFDCQPVHVHGACAALAGIAADICPCQSEYIPQIMHEQKTWFNFVGSGLPVDSNGNGLFHWAS